MRQRIRKRLASYINQYPTATPEQQTWEPTKGTTDETPLNAMEPELPHVPVGGRLSLFLPKWKEATSDPAVLDIVSGMHIDLSELPVQSVKPREIITSEEELSAADEHIAQLIEKRAVTYATDDDKHQFFSNVFMIPKRDSGWRIILNLKSFNRFVRYFHFKMSTLNHILATITPFIYMSVFDLTDAYLTVKISPDHVSYLKFIHRGVVLMYLVLPFGISSAPRKFTKVLVPILSLIHKMGIVCITYIDDGYTCSPTFDLCFTNICTIMRIFSSFGFILHRKKSAPFPSQRVRSLGFILDSITMTISLPHDKISNAIQVCDMALVMRTFSIRSLAQLIGIFISLFPACPLGRAHYRSLEKIKVLSLQCSCGNYDALCSLDNYALADILWWKDNIPYAACPIHHGNATSIMFTDSSDYAWSAVYQGVTAHGFFTPEEASNIIAFKELLAMYYGLLSFKDNFVGNFILIRSDSVCAVCYLREMGGMTNSLMNNLALTIWDWAVTNGFWLHASFLRVSLNQEADFGSRVLSDCGEWTVPMKIVEKITQKLVLPTIDLFASRLNARLNRYISWFPDPFSENVDAFSVSWSNEIPYLFPPFSLLHRCLSKLTIDSTQTALLIFPLWVNQPWLVTLLNMLTSKILLLPEKPGLFLPWTTTPMQHPLYQSLLLGAATASSNPLKQTLFRQTLKKSSNMDSGKLLKRCTRGTIKNGFCLQVQERLIPICPL